VARVGRGAASVVVMRYEVTDADTAASVGSGDVAVLATPRLIAWLEAATVQAAARFVAPGQTTVGTAVRIEHRRATKVSGTIEVFAEPPSAPAGRVLTFLVRAVDDSGHIVATGEIDRAIVDREQFLAR
jgi:fluoroacetyl-CoA thioesterase